MLYVIAQIIGFLAMAVLFVSFQMPTKRKILILQTVAIVIFSVHFFILGFFSGSFAGMIMNVVAAFRTLLFCFEDRKWFRRWLFTGFFLAVIGVSSVITWNGIYSVFPLIGMIDTTLCLNIRKEKWFRICSFPSSPMWLIYNARCHSYSGVISETLTMISIITALIRYDILKRKQKKKDASEALIVNTQA